MTKFIKDKLLNVLNIELYMQLKLHLLLHSVLLCFTYAVDDDGTQTGGLLGSVFAVSNIGPDDVGGLTWLHAGTSCLRCS